MSEEKSFHMSPEEIRKHGQQLLDWMVEYYQNIEKYPVLSKEQPGDIRASLPDAPPMEG